MSFGLLFSQLKTANLQSTRISRGCSYLYLGVNYSYLSVLTVLGGTSVEDIERIVPSFFMVHIGKTIKEVMESQERTPTWLARIINCERTNIYYIFQQSSINTELLLKISIALNHDFFSYYSAQAAEDVMSKDI